MPDAEYLYACDQKWWELHLEDVRQNFRGKLYTQFHNPQAEKFAKDSGLEAIEGKGGNGLGRDCLKHGSNSGHQAINLAYLLGATHIYLLGYDMQGDGHWFGDHPKPLHQGNKNAFVNNFDAIARELKAEGVEVINFTRSTALRCFSLGNFDDWNFHR